LIDKPDANKVEGFYIHEPSDPRLTEIKTESIQALKKISDPKKKVALLVSIVQGECGTPFSLQGLRAKQHFNLRQKKKIFLGAVLYGFSQHCAFLFKFLADANGIPTKLFRTAEPPMYYNIVLHYHPAPNTTAVEETDFQEIHWIEPEKISGLFFYTFFLGWGGGLLFFISLLAHRLLITIKNKK